MHNMKRLGSSCCSGFNCVKVQPGDFTEEADESPEAVQRIE